MLDQISHQISNQVQDTTLGISPVTEQCIVQTAERYDLPDLVLRAILSVEGGKPGDIRVNNNGSYDIGPMQINSVWLSKFNKYTTIDKILYNGCVNLQVGAWILKYNINKAGGDLWQGIGNYHSNTPELHNNYRNKIFLAAQKIKQNIKI